MFFVCLFVSHRCNLCDDIVLREGNELAIHFYTKHGGMDPHRYFYNYHDHSADREGKEEKDEDDDNNNMEDDKEEQEEEHDCTDVEEEEQEEEEQEEERGDSKEEEKEDKRILHWKLHSVIATQERRLFDDHECRICGAGVRSSTATLNRHLRGRHGINVLQYCQVFVLAGQGGEGDACCYRCRVCRDHFAASRLDMVFHLAERHQGAGAGARLEEEESLEPWACSMLECHLCGERVRHDREEIRAHAADVHRLCPEGFFSGLRTELRRRAMRWCVVRMERMSEAAIRAKTSSFRTWQIRGHEEEEEEVKGDDHQGQAEAVVTHRIANLATFSCRWCDFSCALLKELRSHLASSGWCSSQAAGRRLLARHFVSPGSAWHGCLLCRKRVVCTLNSITKHIFKRHSGVGMEEYRNRVRRASGLDRATRTDVANLCTFSCPECTVGGTTTTFRGWRPLRRHMKEKHSSTPSNYSKSTVGTLQKELFLAAGRPPVWHQCQLCPQRVLCDLENIHLHVRRHGMTLCKYIQLIKEGKKGAGPQVPRPPLTVGGSGCAAKRPCRGKEARDAGEMTTTFGEWPLLNQHMKEKHSSGSRQQEEEEEVKSDDHQGQAEAVVTNRIANLATFSCRWCDFSCALWKELRLHLASSGRCSSRAAGRKLLRCDFMSPRSAWHGCVLCGERVLCTVDSITKHVHYRHPGIGMEEYRRRVRRASGQKVTRTNMANLCTFSCPECAAGGTTTTFGEWPLLRRHMKEEHSPGSRRQEEEEEVKGDDHQGEGGVVVTHKVANLATFSCRWCDFSSAFWKELRLHLVGSKRCSSRVARGMDLLRDFVSPGSAWHACVLCGKRVVCTVHSIRLHISRWHSSVRMEEYRDRVRRKLGLEGVTRTDVANLCTFSCPKCAVWGTTTTFRGWRRLRQHMKEKHSSTPSNHSKSTVGSREIEIELFLEAGRPPVWHQCQVCRRRVLCDLDFIGCHVRLHRMTLRKYIQWIKGGKRGAGPQAPRPPLAGGESGRGAAKNPT